LCYGTGTGSKKANLCRINPADIDAVPPGKENRRKGHSGTKLSDPFEEFDRVVQGEGGVTENSSSSKTHRYLSELDRNVTVGEQVVEDTGSVKTPHHRNELDSSGTVDEEYRDTKSKSAGTATGSKGITKQKFDYCST
jgi:hypothetical protein